MDKERRVGQVGNYNPQGGRLRRRPKNRWWNYRQTDIDRCKLWVGKRDQKADDWRCPLRSALDCCFNEGEEGKEGKEGGEKGGEEKGGEEEGEEGKGGEESEVLE